MEIIKGPVWIDGWQGDEDSWYDFDEDGENKSDGEDVWSEEEDDE